MREWVSDAGRLEGCSRWMGRRQKKSGGRRWRVWSEGCVGGEGRRQSEESEREYRGGEIWRGSKVQSCWETCSRGIGSCSGCVDGQEASEEILAEGWCGLTFSSWAQGGQHCFGHAGECGWWSQGGQRGESCSTTFSLFSLWIAHTHSKMHLLDANNLLMPSKSNNNCSLTTIRYSINKNREMLVRVTRAFILVWLLLDNPRTF